MNEKRTRLQSIRGAERVALAKQVLEYEAWSSVRRFAYALFGKQARHVVLSLGYQRRGSTLRVEWVTAYDAQWNRLPYDFTRSFWQRHFPGDETTTILDDLDSSLKAIIGEHEIRPQERAALRQDLANDWFDDDRSVFQELPAETGRTEYDLTCPPPPIPAIFCSYDPPVRSQGKMRHRSRQSERTLEHTMDPIFVFVPQSWFFDEGGV